MVTIPLKTRLRKDGMLDLHVPTGLPESDVEVLVVVQPVAKPLEAWPDHFFEQTFGAFAETPLERGKPGEFERREAVR